MSSLSIEEKARIFLDAVEELRDTDQGVTPEGLAAHILARHGDSVFALGDGTAIISYLNGTLSADHVTGVAADLTLIRRLITKYGSTQLKAIIDQLST